MIEAIEQFCEEMLGRYKLMESGVDTNDRSKYPTRLLVLDEMGSLISMMKMHYVENVKQRGMPAAPPWFSVIMMILWQGRAAGFHVITAAQQGNAAVLINSDARDQYGLKIAAGPQSRGAWGMLFGEERQQAAGNIKGRAIIGVGAELQEVQLAYITPAESRALALAGRADPGTAAAPAPQDARELPDSGNVVRLAAELPDRAVPAASGGPLETVTIGGLVELTACSRVAPAAGVKRTGQGVGGGRPPLEARPAVKVTHETCGTVWESYAKSGQWVKCPTCKDKSGKVPERATM